DLARRLACQHHPRPAPAGWGHFDQDRWCLYQLHSDRSQLHDLASEQPELLAELQALWDEQARLSRTIRALWRTPGNAG
ncbi:MAG TPA: hypothetical protein VGU21_09915, partial [Streptosporangiaceae bacterium]|nr:hypothetical protein [Streptosporangiaceae bacterium]